jgi:hypothetical protein
MLSSFRRFFEVLGCFDKSFPPVNTSLPPLNAVLMGLLPCAPGKSVFVKVVGVK